IGVNGDREVLAGENLCDAIEKQSLAAAARVAVDQEQGGWAFEGKPCERREKRGKKSGAVDVIEKRKVLDHFKDQVFCLTRILPCGKWRDLNVGWSAIEVDARDFVVARVRQDRSVWPDDWIAHDGGKAADAGVIIAAGMQCRNTPL